VLKFGNVVFDMSFEVNSFMSFHTLCHSVHTSADCWPAYMIQDFI